MNIIFANPYADVRDICKSCKAGLSQDVFDKFVIPAAVALPPRAVLIPMPCSSGEATYTKSMAYELAMHANERGVGRTACVLNCLRGHARDSVCGRKEKGEPFDDIEFGFFLGDYQDERLRKFVDDGWSVVLVDNVVDTGTTARAAMEALGYDCGIGIVAIGDTGAWKFFEND